MRPLLQIASAPYRGFWTGTAQSSPAVIGFLSPGLVLILFDREGKVQVVQSRRFSPDLLSEWRFPPVDPAADNRVLRPKSFDELHGWQAEIGFVEEKIAAKPFDLRPEFAVALDYAPAHMKEILSRPDDFDPQEVEEARDYVEEWQDWYTHSFTWDVEYHLDPDGTICST